MFASPLRQAYDEPNVFVQSTRMDMVDSFVYIGSTLSKDGSLESEKISG